MKKNTTLRSKLFWVGEHSYELYKNTDHLILDNFDNQVLLYQRLDNSVVNEKEIVFLDEFFPMNTREYCVSDLQKPVSLFMKDRKIPFEEGVIIGDASEILVQTVVEVGTLDLVDEDSLGKTVADFDLVHKMDSSAEFNKVDVSNFSILFLKEAMLFKDTLEEAKLIKNKAPKTFNKVISEKGDNLKMNEFLFHLENGLEEAISKSGGVELYAI